MNLPQRPITDDPEAWKAYWKAQGQFWRSEPEIDAERQQYLAERRAIVPDIMLGDTYARLAAVEAVIGLFIEISFIATFTKRFFGS